MNYAVFYNSFVCLMIAVISWFAARALRKTADPSPAWRSLARSWDCAALLWFFAALRLAAYFCYLRAAASVFFGLDRLFFYANEIALAGQVLFIVMFVGQLYWRAPAVRAVAAVVGASLAAFLISLFWGGVERTISTPWASRHLLSATTFRCFLPAYGLSLFLVLYAMIREVGDVRRNPRGRARQTAPALAALLLYAAVGVVDVRGVWGGWQLLLIRTSHLVAALITFWTAQPADASMQMVRRRRDA
jgi:hypothetical protein